MLLCFEKVCILLAAQVLCDVTRPINKVLYTSLRFFNKILKLYTVQLNRTYFCANLRVCMYTVDCATSGLSTVMENVIVKCAKIWMRSGMHKKTCCAFLRDFFKYLAWSLNLVASGLLSFQCACSFMYISITLPAKISTEGAILAALSSDHYHCGLQFLWVLFGIGRDNLKFDKNLVQV